MLSNSFTRLCTRVLLRERTIETSTIWLMCCWRKSAANIYVNFLANLAPLIDVRDWPLVVNIRVPTGDTTSQAMWILPISPTGAPLIHWGRMTHTCASTLTIIISDNGLLPRRNQAIIWTNDGILLIGPLGIHYSEILIKILTFSFREMCLKVSSANWIQFCLGLNVLKSIHWVRLGHGWVITSIILCGG